MNSKQQGDIGVAQAIAYYTTEGYAVSLPLGDNTRYDLIIDKEGTLYRVQVKSTSYFDKNRKSYIACLGTSGGNKSGTKPKKRLNKEEFDLLFIYVLPTKEKYEFSSETVNGTVSMSLKNKHSLSP